ncbi:sensor histidine kinase [Microbispora sp. NPDC049125]|uniref:sensor histidine kinase n=1 Tax=Microbispora sp. NPDC049125 TaxID=3154929 RepID=UPI003465F70A
MTVTAAVAAATLWPSLSWASGGWWKVVLALAASVPLLWRRRAPVRVAVLVGVATTGLSLAQAMPPLPYGALAGTYTVAALSPLRWQLPAVACWAVSLAVSFAVPGEPLDSLGYVGMAFVTAYALGMGARAHRAEVAALEERAHRLEEESAAAAARERERIVRDMHDILTHSVGMMIVQAEAGVLTVRPQPDRAEAAFEAIGRTGREAVGQLRHIFGVLRAGTARVEPSPGLDDLDRLAEQVRRAGLTVTVESRGPARPVSAEVGVTAYRLVQESLTNVVRHSGATEVRVRLDWSRDELRIEVADDGRGQDGGHGPAASVARRTAESRGGHDAKGTGDGHDLEGTGGGQGLAGMRERVTACGGTVRAGPGGAGGFTVVASLPIGLPA